MRVGIFCKLTVKPEYMEAFLELMEVHSTSCPAEEEGCVMFRVARDRDDPAVIRIYEEYLTQADVDLHNSSERLAAFGPKIEPMLDEIAVRTGNLPW